MNAQNLPPANVYPVYIDRTTYTGHNNLLQDRLYLRLRPADNVCRRHIRVIRKV